MLTKEELLRLIASNESVRVEKTVSTTDKDKFGEAVCAFANDMADTGRPGYLLVGVHDDRSHVLGYVNRYNRSIATLQKELVANGNGNAEFSLRLITAFEAKVSVSGGKAADVALKDGDMALKDGHFAAKTSDFAAKTVVVAPKPGDVAPKTDDVAPKTGDVAPKTGDVTATMAYDVVDKKLRVTLSDVLKVKRVAAREAIFEKCTFVYFSMKEEVGISRRALAVKLKMSPRSISRYQALLVQAGLLTHIGPKNGGEWKFSI